MKTNSCNRHAAACYLGVVLSNGAFYCPLSSSSRRGRMPAVSSARHQSFNLPQRSSGLLHHHQPPCLLPPAIPHYDDTPAPVAEAPGGAGAGCLSPSGTSAQFGLAVARCQPKSSTCACCDENITGSAIGGGSLHAGGTSAAGKCGPERKSGSGRLRTQRALRRVRRVQRVQRALAHPQPRLLRQPSVEQQLYERKKKHSVSDMKKPSANQPVAAQETQSPLRRHVF